MTLATVPKNDAEVFQDYYKLIKWHVAKAKISEVNVEDFAMELMEKFIDKGLLAQYDPERANFRTFLSGFVMPYLYHFKARDLKQADRSYASTDYTVGDKDNSLILDLQGYTAPDMYDIAETNVLTAQVRAKIVETGDPKFLLFFDLVMLQVEEHGERDVKELSELFGVSRWSVHLWFRKLRTYFEECQ